MVALMALFAVCTALFVTSRSPACPWSERLATALALGLALFLWLPYLSARVWGITQGAWISFGILALLASAGLARVIFSQVPDIGVHWRAIAGADKVDSLNLTRWWPGLILLTIAVALGYLLYNTSLHVRDGGLWSAGAGCEDMGLHATLANAFLHSHERILRPTYSILPKLASRLPFSTGLCGSDRNGPRFLNRIRLFRDRCVRTLRIGVQFLLPCATMADASVLSTHDLSFPLRR